MRARPVGLLTTVLLAIACSALPGCATHNGSVAAFCKELPNTPAISNLVTAARAGTADEAVARIRAMAGSMRTLERVAPRTIRADVATTANFAEHVADELHKLPPADALSHVPTQLPPGLAPGIEVTPTSIPAAVLVPTTAVPPATVPATTVAGSSATTARRGRVTPPGTANPPTTSTLPYQASPLDAYGSGGYLYDPRAQALANAFGQYPRSVTATQNFVDYAATHCGKGVVPKGYDSNQFGRDPGFYFN